MSYRIAISAGFHDTAGNNTAFNEFLTHKMFLISVTYFLSVNSWVTGSNKSKLNVHKMTWLSQVSYRSAKSAVFDAIAGNN